MSGENSVEAVVAFKVRLWQGLHMAIGPGPISGGNMEGSKLRIQGEFAF